MIGFLRGVLAHKEPPFLLIDVGGIGYEVEAPMSTCFRLPATGEKVDWRADCQHGFLMGNHCDGRGRLFNLTVIAHRINETSSLAYGASGNCGPNQPLRSPHAGGVDVGFADGSTRFLSDGIEFQVLCNLANRKDGKVIDATSF